MIYGYALRQLSDAGLLELKEVTFACEPGVLLEIASFLASMADRLEKGKFKHTHVHIDTEIESWADRFPEKNVIVALPDSWRGPSDERHASS